MANYYVTTTGAGTKSGADWANAFDWAAFETHSTASAAAGDTYWVAGGTYSLGSTYSNQLDGVNMIGVNTGTTAEPPTVSDHATGTNRPLIDCGGYHFFVDDYWVFKNLRFTGTYSYYTVDCDYWNLFVNCSIANTNASCLRTIFVFYGVLVDCEVSGAGTKILESYGALTVLNCYVHGAASIGIYSAAGTRTTINTIVNGPDTGIDLHTLNFNIIVNNTIYGCSTTGIDLTASAKNTVINNTISNCGTGIAGNSSEPQALLDYNNYYNNTTDITNLTKGPNALAVDPGFTDAANGDFSLSSSSGLIGTGFGIRLGVS